MREKLFLIRQLALASNSYCTSVGSKKSEFVCKSESWLEYSRTLEEILSRYIIEVLISLRMFEDLLNSHGNKSFLNSAENIVSNNRSIGQMENNSFDLTIRESCNKVIHATRVDLEWVESDNEEITYWSGNYTLSGKKGRKNWKLIVFTDSWAQSMKEYIDEIENSDINWPEIYD